MSIQNVFDKLYEKVYNFYVFDFTQNRAPFIDVMRILHTRYLYAVDII